MTTGRWLFVAMAVLAVASCTQNSKAKRNIYGQVETQEIDVASRVAARVKRVAVQAGQRVKAGDVLVEFEDDIIAAKRKQAEAMLQAAESKKEIALDAVRPEEKEQLKAAVGAARKQMEFARSSFNRAKNAFKEGAISQQNLDEIEFKYQSAVEAYNAAAAKQRMGAAGAREEEKLGASALVHQAENAVAEVAAFSKDMTLTAPIDGEVFQVLNHEGELVPAGYPVVTLLKMSETYVTFNLPETRLKEFPMGKPVKVTIPASGLDLKGEIYFVSPMAGFANQVSTQDRGVFEVKTFEVRAHLSADAAEKLRPGMTALIQPGT